MSYHGNGSALVPTNGRLSRQVAMLDRLAFSSEADIRTKQQTDTDELQTAKLAEKVSDGKRAMEKYACGMSAVAELFRRMDSEDLSAAEAAITQQMMREHQAVMTTALAEFCSNVDAEKIVSVDVERLRESVQGGNGRRRKAMKPSDTFSIQED